MRTTLDLDADVLAAAKEIARREGRTAGAVVSDLVRLALTQGGRAARPPAAAAAAAPPPAHGFAAFASRGGVVSNDLVNRLRDDAEY